MSFIVQQWQLSTKECDTSECYSQLSQIDWAICMTAPIPTCKLKFFATNTCTVARFALVEDSFMLALIGWNDQNLLSSHWGRNPINTSATIFITQGTYDDKYQACSSRVLLFLEGAEILPKDASEKEQETTSENTWFVADYQMFQTVVLTDYMWYKRQCVKPR